MPLSRKEKRAPGALDAGRRFSAVRRVRPAHHLRACLRHVFAVKDEAFKLCHMKLFNACAVAMLAASMASADPIHAVGDGSYWHHDSGWIFPANGACAYRRPNRLRRARLRSSNHSYARNAGTRCRVS
jgi:hypothetical protein